MLHLVGESPAEVTASGESYLQPGVEDVVFGRIKFPSGIIGHLHLSWLDPHKMRKMTVIGAEKMVVFDDMETDRKVTVYDKGPIPRTDTYGEYIQVRSGDIHIPKIPGTEPLKLVCERFVQAVRDRQPTPSDGVAGAEVVTVLTEWPQYVGLDPHALRERVASPRIIDGRNCLDPAAWRAAGWTYRALGRP